MPVLVNDEINGWMHFIIFCVSLYLDSRDICKGFYEILFINCPRTFLGHWEEMKIRTELIKMQVCVHLNYNTSIFNHP